MVYYYCFVKNTSCNGGRVCLQISIFLALFFFFPFSNAFFSSLSRAFFCSIAAAGITITPTNTHMHDTYTSGFSPSRPPFLFLCSMTYAFVLRVLSVYRCVYLSWHPLLWTMLTWLWQHTLRYIKRQFKAADSVFFCPYFEVELLMKVHLMDLWVMMLNDDIIVED